MSIDREQFFTPRRGGHSVMRSLRLVIISLAMVGLAFGVYQLGVEPVAQEKMTADEVPQIYREWLTNSDGADPQAGGILFRDQVPVRVIDKPGITIYDQNTLRKKIHMKFDNPRQVDDSGRLFRMDNPVITYYMRRGETAVIRADEALVTSRERGKIEPQRGELLGHVRIDVDRRADDWRERNPQLANRPPPQDLLARMWMDRLEFDLDLGRLRAPGRVRMEAREMLLEGEGLRIRWSERTGRIEHLVLDSGKQLVFRDELGLSDSLSRGQTEEKPSHNEEPLVEQVTGSVVGQASPTAQGLSSQKDTADPILDDQDVLIVDLPDDDPVSSKRIISYKIDFESDVSAVESRGSAGRLRADHLSVLFDLAPAASESRGQAQRAGQEQAAADTVTQANTPPGDGNSTIVTWSGPLEIHAVGEVEDPGAKLRRHLTATGSPVILESSDGRATSAEFVYHQETRFTQFLGDESFPVKIEGGPGSQFSARDSILWDLEQLSAVLRGEVRVEIEGAVLRGQVVHAFFRAPQQDIQKRTPRELLEKLVCQDDVSLETETDRVTCRHLTVHLAPDAEGRNLPRRSHAVGEVRVLQGQRILSARDVMDVTFGDLPVDEQGNVLRDTPNVIKLSARGAVRIIDPPRGWDISGEQLECEFDEAQRITYGYIEGQPGHRAQVKMGEYYVEGRTVTFDDAREWAHVPGAGIARFVIEEDLDGRRTDEPVPVEVRWDREMTLRGKENILQFDGHAVLASKDNTLTGDVLRVLLADVKPQPEVQVASADPMGMWYLSPFKGELRQVGALFGNEPRRQTRAGPKMAKRARYILADGRAIGNAMLMSRSESPADGRLESVLTLEAPQIAFDLEAKVMLVEHAGRLGIQDYPAESKLVQSPQPSPRRGLFSDTRSEGPSQTLIMWDSAMRYYFAQRVAEFQADDEPLLLRHVTGAHVKMTEELKRAIRISDEQLERLRASGRGRITELHCRQLLVQFERSQSRGGRGSGEMSIGELSQFQASGDVILNDSEWQVRGRRLDYVDGPQLISVYGPRGQDAFVNYKDRKTGEYRQARCPELRVEMKTGYVDAPGCRVDVGGR